MDKGLSSLNTLIDDLWLLEFRRSAQEYKAAELATTALSETERRDFIKLLNKVEETIYILLNRYTDLPPEVTRELEDILGAISEVSHK